MVAQPHHSGCHSLLGHLSYFWVGTDMDHGLLGATEKAEASASSRAIQKGTSSQAMMLMVLIHCRVWTLVSWTVSIHHGWAG
jgi:hypothetical protein